jgi:hypothetical protein
MGIALPELLGKQGNIGTSTFWKGVMEGMEEGHRVIAEKGTE